jgi:hypothetical protein
MVQAPIGELATTFGKSLDHSTLHLTQFQAVAKEAAQILPNIPLTILQLSFSGVKGNLTVGARGCLWEQAHD